MHATIAFLVRAPRVARALERSRRPRFGGRELRDRLGAADVSYPALNPARSGRPQYSTGALCDGTIAIGGSMILGDDFVLNFASNAPTTVKMTGGTSTYRHAHGTIIAKTVGNNTDLTIRVAL